MPLLLVRIWLPDRPGALGQVASRIGAVRGDVVGIEILERGAGRAIDELVVSLPEDALIELLVNEIAQVDGVDVEDVRPIVGEPLDASLAGLGIAERMARTPAGRLAVLCAGVQTTLECEWVSVLQLRPAIAVAAVGEAPSAAWLAAFLDGTSHLESSADEGMAPPDLAWAALVGCPLELAAGRRSPPFRSRERRQLAALARLAGALLAAADVDVGSGLDPLA